MLHPRTLAPGQPSEVLLSLETGSYAILCFVESGDRIPHLAKGMIRGLAVVPGRRRKSPSPGQMHGWCFWITSSG